MEVMRANQRRVAQSLAGPKNQRSDTREVKKGLAIVPFRHSKLTEVLMDYFTGDGRAVSLLLFLSTTPMSCLLTTCGYGV